MKNVISLTNSKLDTDLKVKYNNESKTFLTQDITQKKHPCRPPRGVNDKKRGVNWVNKGVNWLFNYSPCIPILIHLINTFTVATELHPSRFLVNFV